MLLLLWAVFQNFWNLAAANVEADETVYVKAGWQYVHGDFRLNGEHPFTAKYLMGIAQLILGQGLTSARTAAAVASLVTGVIIWWWLRTEVGRTTGMLAAAMWLLLPRQISLFWGPREDRYALLEPFMMMFGVAAMAAGWWWYRSGRWSPMALSAVAIALAATSKVSIAVVAPVLVLMPLLARRDRRTARQAVAFVVIAAGVAALTFVPAGDPVAAVRRMLAFQARQDGAGHVVEVAGMVTSRPPWWTNLYWMAQGIGWLASGGLVVGVLLLLAYRRSALGLFVGANLGVLAVFYLFVSSVALPHYYYAFLPELIILSAIGLTAPWRFGSVRWTGIPVAVPRALALGAGLLLLVSAVGTSVDTARLHPWGPARIEAALAAAGRPAGPVLITGMTRSEYRSYVTAPVTTYQSNIVAIAVFRGSLRNRPSPELIRLVDEHPANFQRVQLDEIELYIVKVPLAPCPRGIQQARLHGVPLSICPRRPAARALGAFALTETGPRIGCGGPETCADRDGDRITGLRGVTMIRHGELGSISRTRGTSAAG